MINRLLITVAVVAAVTAAGSGWMLYEQVQANGALEESIQQKDRELRDANTAIEAQTTAATEWKALWEGAVKDLVDERRRAAALEEARVKTEKMWSAIDRKLNKYLSEISDEPDHCDNQPVPVDVDNWLRELLRNGVPTESGDS